MLDSVMDYARDTMGSPLIYLIVFVGIMFDAILPIAPSDALLITPGVFAAEGKPNLYLIILTGTLGAMAGDHVSYFIGNKLGRKVAERKGKGYDWARRTVKERGGMVLVVARYIPGGRTAATLTMGATRYPLPKFTLFDAIAASSWAALWTLLGYFGGEAFADDPVKGLLLSFGVAIGLSVLIEVIRWIRKLSPSRSSESSTSGARRHRVP